METPNQSEPREPTLTASDPVSGSAWRCDWLYNERGYQCSERAVWYHPIIDEEGRLKWFRVCEIHKQGTVEEMEKNGIQIERYDWRRIEKPNK